MLVTGHCPTPQPSILILDRAVATFPRTFVMLVATLLSAELGRSARTRPHSLPCPTDVSLITQALLEPTANPLRSVTCVSLVTSLIRTGARLFKARQRRVDSSLVESVEWLGRSFNERQCCVGAAREVLMSWGAGKLKASHVATQWRWGREGRGVGISCAGGER